MSLSIAVKALGKLKQASLLVVQQDELILVFSRTITKTGNDARMYEKCKNLTSSGHTASFTAFTSFAVLTHSIVLNMHLVASFVTNMLIKSASPTNAELWIECSDRIVQCLIPEIC